MHHLLVAPTDTTKVATLTSYTLRRMHNILELAEEMNKVDCNPPTNLMVAYLDALQEELTDLRDDLTACL